MRSCRLHSRGTRNTRMLSVFTIVCILTTTEVRAYLLSTGMEHIKMYLKKLYLGKFLQKICALSTWFEFHCLFLDGSYLASLAQGQSERPDTVRKYLMNKHAINMVKFLLLFGPCKINVVV